MSAQVVDETAAPDVDAQAERGLRGVLKFVSGMVSGAALAAVVLVALVLIVIPLALGATPYTILTGSMEPSMPPGTLVVTRPKPVDEIPLGAVITYQLESNQPAVVTHRVVGVGETSDGERQFLTRGDANNVDDDPVQAVQVRGVVIYDVPYLGYVNSWVGANRPGWLLKAVAAALILYGLVLVGAGARDRIRRRGTDAVDEVDAAPTAVPPVPTSVVAAVERIAPAAGAPAPRGRRPVPLVLGVVLGVLVVGALVAGGRGAVRSR